MKLSNIQIQLIGYAALAALAGITIFQLQQANLLMKVIPHSFDSENYIPVEATIVGYGSMCRMYGNTVDAQAEVDKDPIWKKGFWNDCEKTPKPTLPGIKRYTQLQLVQNDNQYIVSVHYTAPADGSQRVGQLALGVYSSAEEEEAIGKKMTIAAHKTDPEKLHWPKRTDDVSSNLSR